LTFLLSHFYARQSDQVAGLDECSLKDAGESVKDALEQAGYAGDAPAMLVRIASALNRKLEVCFVPASSTDEGMEPASYHRRF